jgi:intraflagellar transport protein 46
MLSFVQIPLPPPDLNVSLADYAKICCALLDIPVHGNVIESLHVMFSLYTEFKDTQQYTGAQ